MGFDGNGNYTRTNGTQTGSSLWQDRAAIAPATISASEHDAEMNDVATALTACIKADGSKVATNNQPMGGFKHTGVADATLANQYATLGQVQTGLSVNDLVVSANNTGSALRVTQIGTGEALRVEDSANPDTTPTVITAAGDVGIGTASPTSKLQVEGTVLVNANSSGDAFRITQTGSGKAFVVEDSANPDTSPFVIADNGKVGIGIANPGALSSQLYVNGEIYGTDTTTETLTATTFIKSAGVALCPEFVGSAFSVLGNASAQSGGIRGANSDGSVSNAGGGTLTLSGGKATGNAAGGPITFSTSVPTVSGITVQSLAERMRVASDGSVSVTSATPVLNVGSSNTSTQDCTLRIGTNRTGDGASAIEMATDTTHGLAGLQITRGAGSNATSTISHKGTGGLLLNCRDAAALAFRTQDTERMRVTSGGNVGIGTTGPSYQLQLSTDSAAKPTTNTWTIASDARIKTNIAPYQKGLTEIRQVAPISYDYNGKGGIPQGPGGVSIIAQDLQLIFPECVGSYRGKLEESDEEETDILNYNGHAITFALINAVKELAAKVDSLEAQLAAKEA
jgi:hypothetical protein